MTEFDMIILNYEAELNDPWAKYEIVGLVD